MNRLTAATIPALLLGILATNHLWPWLPENVAGINLWRIVAVTLGAWLFLIAWRSGSPGPAGQLRPARVECLTCGESGELARWLRRGSCPRCGGADYEFEGRPSWRQARYLPGAVRLAEGPAPAPPTPLARPAQAPRGRLRQPAELARARLGLAARQRVRQRLGELLIEPRTARRI